MERFDYVVVGSGSAGSVLAARLSEDRETSVLVLEAGPRDRNLFVHIPAAFPRLFGTDLDWAYETVPQANLADRAIYWPRGRMLGGSSSMNAMMWLRGAAADYDGWAEQAGPGWSFRSVLPYFRRAEDTEAAVVDDELRGVGGPIPVSRLRDPNPMTVRFLEATPQLGIEANRQVNGGADEGAAMTPATQRRGRRVSAADAYLKPALNRPNLTLRTGAACTRIVFDGRRAVGVAYRVGREERVVQASREVLLAAGSIGSPQLLLCSGIGPADQLAPLSITVLLDNPEVGRHLEDHLASGLAVETTTPVTLTGARSLGALARYVFYRRGPLTSTVAEAVAFVRSDRSLEHPDLELVFLPVPFLDQGRSLPTAHGISLAAVLLQPKSSGTLSLAHPDPSVAPLIDPRYLSDREGADKKALLTGVRLCQGLLEAPAFEGILGPMIAPAGCSGEEAAETAVRLLSQTLYHPVGTCRMSLSGPRVVDEQCRVDGVTALRVVDASVMPRIVRGHTHAPTVMIAERVSDLIRGRPGPS